MSLIRATGAFRCLRPLAVNTMSTRMSSDHHEPVDMVALLKERKATLNDIPVPHGSWDEDYKKRNGKYNLHLAVTGGLLVFSIIFSFQCGAFDSHSIFNVKKYDIKP